MTTTALANSTAVTLSMYSPGVPDWLFVAVGLVLATGLAASVARLIIGPSLADRVVALDLIGFLIVGVVALVAVVSNEDSLMTVAMVGAIILFVATAAFALFIERGERADSENSR
ncbi:MAG: monovalent cation/H+ antiporter complex subunit F [Planctomycetota bacterium]